MKKIIILIILSFSLNIILFSDIVYQDSIVAYVNNTIITERDIREALQNIGWRDVPDDTVRRRVLNQVIIDLVKNELLSEEANKIGITVPDEYLEKQYNQELNNILQNTGGRTNLIAQLNKENISYEKFTSDLKDSIRDFLVKQQLFNQKVFSKIVMTTDDVLWQYNVSTLLVSDFDLAKDILLDLRLQGASFAELAKEHSTGPRSEEGGNLGFIKIGDLQTELESEILNMVPGDVSSIINTRFGYVILKLNKKEQISEKDITAEQLEELKENFFEAKAGLIEKKLYEELWDKYYVNIDYNKLLNIN